MFHIIRAAQRHTTDQGWLKTSWLFSFDDYIDPDNVRFGALRVFNDDIVQPGAGFPTHPHREMEIVTIPLSGAITHRDSLGNQATISAGEVQRMSAGVGVTHSEMNEGDVPVHFYQIWLFPHTAGLPPSYDQRRFAPAAWKNSLCPLASGDALPGVVTLHSNATLYRADLERGHTLEYPVAEGRYVFLYLTSGDLLLNGERLTPHDQARICDMDRLYLLAHEVASFILIDLPPHA
ncbi:MAG TPA: pirin family protein [Armatimonadota bacterium]|jgi:hypothetical protein